MAMVGPGETAGKSGDVSPVRGVRGGTKSSAGLKIQIRSHYGPIAFKFAKYAIFTLLVINMVLFMAGKSRSKKNGFMSKGLAWSSV